MKSQLKYFIFTSLSERLARPLHIDLKTFKFLACTEHCTDFDESHKPLQALYINRQARNIYGTFQLQALSITYALISSVSWLSPLKIIRSLFKVVVNRPYSLGISNMNTGVCLTDFSATDTDTMSDRQLVKGKQPLPTYLLNEGVGGDCFSSLFLFSFVPSNWSAKPSSLKLT